MSDQFKVGEVCIGHGFIYQTCRNGLECEIIEPLQFVTSYNDICGPISGEQYRVRWADGWETWAEPYLLRRKQPPQDLTEWANAKVKQVTKPVNIPQPEVA